MLSRLSYFYYLLILTFLLPCYTISININEHIADNELDLITKDCALQYCVEKNDMALCVKLVNQCVSNPNQYLINQIDINKQNRLDYVTKFVGGLICTISCLFGIIFGYFSTNQKIFSLNYEDDNYESHYGVMN